MMSTITRECPQGYNSFPTVRGRLALCKNINDKNNVNNIKTLLKTLSAIANHYPKHCQKQVLSDVWIEEHLSFFRVSSKSELIFCW